MNRGQPWSVIHSRNLRRPGHFNIMSDKTIDNILAAMAFIAAMVIGVMR